MKMLIEEAERLYRQIDKAQVHLVNARLNNDEEGKKSAISEMETAMCDVSRLLKCFIDRKDNIVDLGEVWHKKEIIPVDDTIFAVNKLGIEYIGRYEKEYVNPFGERTPASFVEGTVIIWPWEDTRMWAYTKDLLPKGGEK